MAYRLLRFYTTIAKKGIALVLFKMSVSGSPTPPSDPRKEIAQLKKELILRNRTVSRTVQANKVLEQTNEDLKKALAECQVRIANLEEKEDEAQVSAIAYEQQIKDLESIIGQTPGSHAVTDIAQVEGLRSENERLKRQVRTLENTNGHLLQAQLSADQDNIGEIDRLRAKLSSLESTRQEETSNSAIIPTSLAAQNNEGSSALPNAKITREHTILSKTGPVSIESILSSTTLPTDLLEPVDDKLYAYWREKWRRPESASKPPSTT